jgi:outer membrane protein TolC
VKTKNGLLPKLDLFISLGKTGYANSFTDSAENLNDNYYEVLAGLTLEYSVGSRADRAAHKQSILNRRLADEAIANLTQLIQLDVRSAYIEVNRAKEQVAATLATRQLKEEVHRAEVEKFRVGRSTSFLVAQAQRDLVESQISEVSSVVNYLKALVALYRLEGSLLERRGISVS